MLQKKLPADKLADVHDEISALRLREVELRKCFTDDCDFSLYEGREFDVEMRLEKRRVLAKDRLPESILNNPRYFDVKLSPIVRVVSRKEPRLPLEFSQAAVIASNDNFEVIEAWN